MWATDNALGKWTKRQRIHKKALDRGQKCSNMTVERVAQLAAVPGFA